MRRALSLRETAALKAAVPLTGAVPWQQGAGVRFTELRRSSSGRSSTFDFCTQGGEWGWKDEAPLDLSLEGGASRSHPETCKPYNPELHSFRYMHGGANLGHFMC